MLRAMSFIFILFIYLFIFINKFIYFWLRWVFVAERGLSLVVAIEGYSLLWCVGSVVVVHGLSCSVAYGVFPDQGSNPCPLHWQADP